MQRLTLIYLATYLLVGRGSFLVAPDLALRLFLSNATYGDIMPRLFGLFMFVLGGVIYQFVRGRDYRYYFYTIVARSFIVLVMTALYYKARDPLPRLVARSAAPIGAICVSGGFFGLAFPPGLRILLYLGAVSMMVVWR